MDAITEQVRNINLELESLKARKDAIKAKALEHRDSVTDLEIDSAKKEVEEVNEKIIEKERELEEVQKRGEKIMNNEILHFDEKMERCDVLATAEYRSAFFKKLQGRTLSEDETRSITAASVSGGVAIPTKTMDEIIGQFKETSTALDLVTILNIPELISLPKENVTTDANWVQEDADSVNGDDTLTNITLNAYKLIRTVKVTAKLQTMAISAFETWVVNTIVKKMKSAIDKAIFSGTGSNQPTGLDGQTWDAANSISIAKASSITYDNLVDLEALVDEDYITNAVFVMNRATLAQVQKIADSGKKPIFERAIEDGFRGFVLGIPVKLDKNVKDGEVYLGDFKAGYVLNFAKAVELQSSMEAGFMSGATVYRGLALLDGKPTGVKGAIVKFVKATA